MPRHGTEPPLVIFTGGPLDKVKRPKTTGGQWPIFRDEHGNRIRSDAGRAARITDRGGVYIHDAFRRVKDAPPGSRVYRWLPRKRQGPAT